MHCLRTVCPCFLPVQCGIVLTGSYGFQTICCTWCVHAPITRIFKRVPRGRNIYFVKYLSFVVFLCTMSVILSKKCKFSYSRPSPLLWLPVCLFVCIFIVYLYVYRFVFMSLLYRQFASFTCWLKVKYNSLREKNMNMYSYNKQQSSYSKTILKYFIYFIL